MFTEDFTPSAEGRSPEPLDEAGGEEWPTEEDFGEWEIGPFGGQEPDDLLADALDEDEQQPAQDDFWFDTEEGS